jgi:penicillin-binding protein 1A
VTLLELTGAYAPFSNGGYAVLPYVIQRIRTPQGDVLFDRSGSGPTRVLSLESVALMNDMLQATVDVGTGSRADLPGWPVGGKTGTSQEFRDAWFVGYTGRLIAGVWLGNDDNTPTKRASGSNLPVDIWSRFMRTALEGVPVVQLPGATRSAQLDLPTPPAEVRDLPAAPNLASEPAAPGVTLDRWLLDKLFGRR